MLPKVQYTEAWKRKWWPGWKSLSRLKSKRWREVASQMFTEVWTMRRKVANLETIVTF